mgnify:CR=1 FL=1
MFHWKEGKTKRTVWNGVVSCKYIYIYFHFFPFVCLIEDNGCCSSKDGNWDDGAAGTVALQRYVRGDRSWPPGKP